MILSRYDERAYLQTDFNCLGAHHQGRSYHYLAALIEARIEGSRMRSGHRTAYCLAQAHLFIDFNASTR